MTWTNDEKGIQFGASVTNSYQQSVILDDDLLSSPTGPAEHWAGGSRAKSFNS